MKISAGILLYRQSSDGIEFLLVHPGGPFWAKKDEHAWSIPKGEMGEVGEASAVETLEAAARREFAEETGIPYEGELSPLPPVKAPGKIIHAFLGEGDFDPAILKSNYFEMEWPPKSGRMASFPEVDRADWFNSETARKKIHKGQIPLIEAAMKILMSK